MINFLSSYLSPANLLNLPPEIDDRLFNAYPRDLPRKIDFVDIRAKIAFIVFHLYKLIISHGVDSFC
jgi:hypothetical protein